MMLHRKICMWLRSKGTPFDSVQFTTGHVGKGPEIIIRWDETLGRRPTDADLAPFDPQLEDIAFGMRQERNRLLAECDWTMLTDSAVPISQRVSWSLYRQALRDITKQEHFPRRVEWPQKPA